MIAGTPSFAGTTFGIYTKAVKCELVCRYVMRMCRCFGMVQKGAHLRISEVSNAFGQISAYEVDNLRLQQILFMSSKVVGCVQKGQKVWYTKNQH